MQLILSGVINITQLVGVVSSLWTMDRFGRRPLLLVGAALMCISHLIIAVMVGEYSYDWAKNKTQGWVAVAFLFAYMLSFGATWGPVPWAIPSEIFPSSLRAKGVGLSTCSNWFNNFIIVSIPTITPGAAPWSVANNCYCRVSSRLPSSRIQVSAHTPFSPSSACSPSYSPSSAYLRRRVSRWSRWTRFSRS